MPFFFTLLLMASFLLSCRYGGYEPKLASHILLSQKPDPKENQVINLDEDVQVFGYFFWWMVDELIWMIPLSSPFFLGYGLSFFFLLLLLFFSTCLVGMWHTFFGYASFFLTCHVGMWHTFFGYASFISFCIAHTLR